MNRLIFLKELEYLLQDIAEEDKRDAIQYYYDYFDDAGLENEEVVLNELGSPERVAAIIRADLNSELCDNGEFTESGYTDPRFEEPIKPLDKYTEPADSTYYEEAEKTRNLRGLYSGRGRWGKILITLLLVFTVIPIAVEILGGILGVLSGIIGVVLLPGAIALAGILGGIVIIVIGVGILFGHILGGVVTIGTGILLVGIGFFAMALSVWFYGTLMPKLFYSTSNLFRSIRKRREKGGSQK